MTTLFLTRALWEMAHVTWSTDPCNDEYHILNQPKSQIIVPTNVCTDIWLVESYEIISKL